MEYLSVLWVIFLAAPDCSMTKSQQIKTEREGKLGQIKSYLHSYVSIVTVYTFFCQQPPRLLLGY